MLLGKCFTRLNSNFKFMVNMSKNCKRPVENDITSTKKRIKKIKQLKLTNNGDAEVNSEKKFLNPIATEIDKIDFGSDALSARNKRSNFKITCWNVDGLRALIKKNGFTFLANEKPDILCFQEIKSESHKIPEDLNFPNHFAKYSYDWYSAKKPGYSGTGLISRNKPINITHGIGDTDHDNEGRVITAEYPNFYLVNVYVPNAGAKLVRLPYRLAWDKCFRAYIAQLDAQKPVIICGDLNVAHKEIDLKNPKTNTKSAGFTPEERESFQSLLDLGFVDTFRHFHPKEEGAYTYWSYMFNARSKNIGWRIDYFLVSVRFLPHVCDVIHRKEVLGSDHCPITLLLDMDE